MAALVSMLYAWVEELRVDVARRGCKVVPSEIHVLSDSVAALARGLLDLQSEPCGSRGMRRGGEGSVSSSLPLFCVSANDLLCSFHSFLVVLHVICV